MRAAVVVECEPGGDAGMRLSAVGIAFEVNVLVLEGAPQALDEHVVHPAAAAVHRDANTRCRQRGGEGGADELAALVSVEDLRSAEARERFLKCRDTERYVHGVR